MCPKGAWYKKKEDCVLHISWKNLPPPLQVKAKKRKDPRRVGCREAETRVRGASWKPASSEAACVLGAWAAPFQWDASLFQCGQRIGCPTGPEARGQSIPGSLPKQELLRTRARQDVVVPLSCCCWPLRPACPPLTTGLNCKKRIR